MIHFGKDAKDDPHGNLFGGKTTELMSGSDTRVLIPEGVDADEAIHNLKEIIEWIENMPAHAGFEEAKSNIHAFNGEDDLAQIMSEEILPF